MDRNFEMARDFFVQGVQHYEAGNFAVAEQQFAAALALAPGRVSALLNLGAARLKLGRAEEALAVLEEALQTEPDNAEALAHQGAALAELGRLEAALASFDRSLALAPASPVAWMHRGTVLKDLGRHAEAARSFEESLSKGGDAELNRYYLAALRGDSPPPAPPRAYVQALFDGYAPSFESHVTGDLRYDAPAVLVQGLTGSGQRYARVLDIGCGSGLCGRLLRPHADRIEGIDLSAAMLEEARKCGAYDSLVQADAHDHLASVPEPYDLVVAADVLIYLGALEPVFSGVSRVLAPGGRFALTLERSDADMELRPSLRYAHSERHLREEASGHGFWVDRVEARVLREEQRQAIPGLFAWLRKG